MHGRGPWVIAAAALMVAGLAGCSAAATPSGGTAAVVAPGHGTAEDAADGLMQNLVSGKFLVACSYFVPAMQAPCRGLRLPRYSGHISVVGAITSGDLALVELTGHICLTGHGCQTNTDSSIGLPSGSETFKQAYDKALHGSTTFSPAPCRKVNGKWYVDAAPA
jgi:hypothetical protein